MALTKIIKEKIIKKFQRADRDTGSADVQVALLTERITALSDHLKLHPNDKHSRRGLLQLVGKRRKLLNYLKLKQAVKYQEIVKKLKIKG